MTVHLAATRAVVLANQKGQPKRREKLETLLYELKEWCILLLRT